MERTTEKKAITHIQKAYSIQVTRKYGNLWIHLITQLQIMTKKSLDWNKGEKSLYRGKSTWEQHAVWKYL